jgi:hypothetical protein
MAYEPKAGSLTLLKNDRKEKDTHPDYKGDGMDLEGNPVWISAWIKEGKNGKFMSLSMQKKEAAPKQRQATTQNQQPSSGFDDLEVPF